MTEENRGLVWRAMGLTLRVASKPPGENRIETPFRLGEMLIRILSHMEALAAGTHMRGVSDLAFCELHMYY